MMCKPDAIRLQLQQSTPLSWVLRFGRQQFISDLTQKQHSLCINTELEGRMKRILKRTGYVEECRALHYRPRRTHTNSYQKAHRKDHVSLKMSHSLRRVIERQARDYY